MVDDGFYKDSAPTELFLPPVANPNGIPSLSPRVARYELPWVTQPKTDPTLKGLHQTRAPARSGMGEANRCNPFRVDEMPGAYPA